MSESLVQGIEKKFKKWKNITWPLLKENIIERIDRIRDLGANPRKPETPETPVQGVLDRLSRALRQLRKERTSEQDTAEQDTTLVSKLFERGTQIISPAPRAGLSDLTLAEKAALERDFHQQPDSPIMHRIKFDRGVSEMLLLTSSGRIVYVSEDDGKEVFDDLVNRLPKDEKTQALDDFERSLGAGAYKGSTEFYPVPLFLEQGQSGPRLRLQTYYREESQSIAHIKTGYKYLEKARVNELNNHVERLHAYSEAANDFSLAVKHGSSTFDTINFLRESLDGLCENRTEHLDRRILFLDNVERNLSLSSSLDGKHLITELDIKDRQSFLKSLNTPHRITSNPAGPSHSIRRTAHRTVR